MLMYREPANTTLSKLITITPNTDFGRWGRLQILGMGGDPTFSTSGGKGEILHHTSDSHFNRKNWLFFQNFPHTFAVNCQGLSCRLSGLQHDMGSFSLPCLQQHLDTQCHSVALPNGFCCSMVHRPNRARLVLLAEGLGHLWPSLPQPAEATPPSGWVLWGACAGGRAGLQLHPPALARVCSGSQGSRAGSCGAGHSRLSQLSRGGQQDHIC